MTRKTYISRNENENPEEVGPTKLQRLLIDEVEKKVAIKFNGQLQEITMREVLLKKLIEAANKGSVHAIGWLSKEIKEAERLKAHELKKLQKLGRDYKTHQQKQLSHAIEAGEDTRLILPHPDDIIIDHREGFGIIGPSDEEELIALEKLIAVRDVYLRQYFLDERMDYPEQEPPIEFEGSQAKGGSALLWVHYLESGWPERFKHTEADMFQLDWQSRRMTKRKLEKDTYQAWKQTDYPKPRGWRTPHVWDAVAMLKLINQEVQSALKGSAPSIA